MLFRIVYFYLCIAISPNTGYGFLISVIYLSAHHVYRQGPSMFTRKQPHGKNPHTFTNFEIMGIIHYSFIKKTVWEDDVITFITAFYGYQGLTLGRIL